MRSVATAMKFGAPRARGRLLDQDAGNIDLHFGYGRSKAQHPVFTARRPRRKPMPPLWPRVVAARCKAGTDMYYRRSCIVRMSFTREVQSTQATMAKLLYLARSGATDPSLGDRCLFTRGADGSVQMMDAATASSMMGEYPTIRIILSPADLNADLQELAMRFVRDSLVSHGLGEEPMAWVAAVHTNTDHPHVHIIVSRAPANERKRRKYQLLRYPSEYAKKTARCDAGSYLDWSMGLCSARERQEHDQREAGRTDWTSIDSTIMSKSRPSVEGGRKVHVMDGQCMANVHSSKRGVLKMRLEALCSMGVGVYRRADGSYVVPDNLRDIMRQRSRLLLLGLDAKDVVIDGPDTQPYEGVVVSWRCEDDHTDVVAMQILADDGTRHVLVQRVGPSRLGTLSGSRVSVVAVPAGKEGVTKPRLAKEQEEDYWQKDRDSKRKKKDKGGMDR